MRIQTRLGWTNGGEVSNREALKIPPSSTPPPEFPLLPWPDYTQRRDDHSWKVYKGDWWHSEWHPHTDDFAGVCLCMQTFSNISMQAFTERTTQGPSEENTLNHFYLSAGSQKCQASSKAACVCGCVSHGWYLLYHLSCSYANKSPVGITEDLREIEKDGSRC